MEKERLQKIFRKTDGFCHICHDKLNFLNYGFHGSKGAWEVEHSIPKSKGGSDNLNNLYAAHISCNREKGAVHTKTARAKYGNTRAPYSKKQKQKIRDNNTAAGTIIGGAFGSIFGPLGTMIGASLGAAIGNSNSPKK